LQMQGCRVVQGQKYILYTRARVWGDIPTTLHNPAPCMRNEIGARGGAARLRHNRV